MQDGCCETAKATYHDDPVYTVDDVVHYCVGNMPGAVPGTSTIALTNATYKDKDLSVITNVEDWNS